MEKTFQTLEFDKILNKLEELALTENAKERIRNLQIYLSEDELKARMNETTEAKRVLEEVGTPALVSMKDIDRILEIASKGGMLTAEELEYIATTLKSINRLKDFLNRAKKIEVSIAYFADEIIDLEDVREEIERCIRDGKILDNATSNLKDIRRNIINLEEKIKQKADSILLANKKYCSEDYTTVKGGHVCIPIKKEYKSKIEGSVIEKSRTGGTLFVEPAQVEKISTELSSLKLEEENEEIKILYMLTSSLSECFDIFTKNKRIIEELDFIFAKAKLSVDLNGIEPKINTKRYIKIEKARHPLIDKTACVPLDFEIGENANGIIITGPNTGGKTVCIKTVGLFCLMAQCGLHVPAENADICMNNDIFCDIGDGQDINQNLSTFSAHISNILQILGKVTNESLVILDELGSGTDPLEGMGIAIAILEELRKRNCLFLVTTHYAEVKEYGEKADGVINSRMAFDRATLKPLYKLEIGKSGESQALYIAKKLGMPRSIIENAYKYSYKEKEMDKELLEGAEKEIPDTNSKKKIKESKEHKEASKRAESFNIGDSVVVHPENKIGIVCKKADEEGKILVQMQDEKVLVNHKRLELKVPANMLYPEDYDFSIIFDTVENRKKRHQMSKKHCEGMTIEIDNEKKL